APSVDEAGEARIKTRRTTDGERAPLQTRLPIRICAYPLSFERSPEAQSSRRAFYAHTDIPMRRPTKGAGGLPARFTASGVGSEGIDAEVSVVAELGEPLVDKGGKDWNLIGDAVHAYLGLPLSSLTEEMA